jgi:hypothetical protein
MPIVISAKNIPKMDRNGLADPYVVVTVGGEQKKTQVQVTHAVCFRCLDSRSHTERDTEPDMERAADVRGRWLRQLHPLSDVCRSKRETSARTSSTLT